jgi:hypothetical protein
MKRFVGVLVLVAGCGGSPTSDDVGVDAFSVDANVSDAGTPVDIGIAPSDAYSAPDAPVLAPCDRAGATEIRACGNCGEASFRCESGAWMIQTPCLGEGECSAGSFETETNPMCGQRTRLCSATCGWGTWSETRPDGECVAGARRVGDGTCPRPTDAEFETCDATCRWNTTGVCEDADGCRTTPRTTPAWSEEVCVRAGTFIRDPFMAAYPTAEIEMSAFLIDRYTVTNRRYLECYRAGACPLDFMDEATLASPEFADQDFWITGNNAGAVIDAFCSWDGGRLVPTAAQWEYAARGPAPRTNRAPWDSDYRPTSYVETCRFVTGGMSDCDFRRYDGLPMVRSYFGVERQVGSAPEHMRDWFASDAWFSGPESTRRDPYQSIRPFENAPRMARGGVALSEFNLLNRGVATEGRAFRCARPDTL